LIGTCTDSELLSSTTTDVKYLPGLTNVHIVACYLGATWLCIWVVCPVDMFEFKWMPTWDTLTPIGPPLMSLFGYHSLCFLLTGNMPTWQVLCQVTVPGSSP